MLVAIRGMPRASARQGAIQIADLKQLAGPPALNKGYAMFTLTLQVGKGFKLTIKAPVAMLLLLLSMLA